MGAGVNFALLKENKSGDPIFYFFFLKGVSICNKNKTERLLMIIFLITLHNVYIELSSKYVGGG